MYHIPGEKGKLSQYYDYQGYNAIALQGRSTWEGEVGGSFNW